MTSQRDAIDRAMNEVAGVVGVDTAFVAPPDERHFDPVTVAVGFAGVLLSSFLKGFVAEAGSDAEKAGRATWTFLRERIQRLFDGGADADAAASEVGEALQDARATVQTVPDERVDVLAERTRQALEAELVAAGMPDRRARRAAESVRAQALELVRATAE